MERRQITFSLLGDIRLNSRALRQISALVNNGFDVHAIGFGTNHSTTSTTFQLTTLPKPEGSGPKYFWQSHRLLSSELKTVDSDFYHASDLYCLPASAAASKHRNSQLSLDSRELYSHVESIKSNPLKSWIWKEIERHYLPQCDHVYTVSESIADFLQHKYSIERPTVILNTPDIANQTKSNVDLRKIVTDQTHLVILHNGQVRSGRGCENLAAAFQYVSSASLVFMGRGPQLESIVERAKRIGYADKIFQIDPVPPDQVISATTTADIGATMLEDTCLNHRFALPNKLFEYAHAGLPILGSNLPEISRMIDDHEIGTTVNSDSAQIIGRKIESLALNRHILDQWRKNTTAFSETFSWKKASEAFLQHFQ